MMNARVEVYMHGRLIATLCASRLDAAVNFAVWQRAHGFHALVIYGRA